MKATVLPECPQICPFFSATMSMKFFSGCPSRTYRQFVQHAKQVGEWGHIKTLRHWWQSRTAFTVYLMVMDKEWPCQVAFDLNTVTYDCRLTCCSWAINDLAHTNNTLTFIRLKMPKLAWELYGLDHFTGWIWPVCHCMRLLAASCLQFNFLCEKYHWLLCFSWYNSNT